MKIVGTASSPFTRKVRVVAHEKRLSVEFVIDSPLAADSRVPALNPLGKVPVLVLDDGSTLIDSPLIAEYLDGLAGDRRLLPPAGPEHFAVREWEAIGDGVLDAAVLVRMEQLRPESERSRAWIERQQGKIEAGLAQLERRLGARAHCVGDALTLADITVGCCIGYLELRFAGGEWRRRFPGLGRLMGVLEQRASFRATPATG